MKRPGAGLDVLLAHVDVLRAEGWPGSVKAFFDGNQRCSSVQIVHQVPVAGDLRAQLTQILAGVPCGLNVSVTVQVNQDAGRDRIEIVMTQGLATQG